MFRKLHFRRKRSELSRDELSIQGAAPSVRSASPVPTKRSSIGVQGLHDKEDHATNRSATANSSEIPENRSIDPGSFGLNVIYTPQNGHKADIVFIHGLGGTSKGTWTKSKDPELFWPLKFLALEPDIRLARILTFGYNAAFRKAGDICVSLLDFAKDLLFDLRYGQNQEKEDLGIGQVSLQEHAQSNALMLYCEGATNIRCPQYGRADC
jgi:hypothetical protein